MVQHGALKVTKLATHDINWNHSLMRWDAHAAAQTLHNCRQWIDILRAKARKAVGA